MTNNMVESVSDFVDFNSLEECLFRLATLSWLTTLRTRLNNYRVL